MKNKKADILFINAKVVTMEDDCPYAEAVAIRDNKILFVGKDREALDYADSDTEVINLRGRLLLPGFIESHCHAIYYAEQCAAIKISGDTTNSRKKVLEQVANAAAKVPEGTWLFGWGWDEARFEEGPEPLNRHILDSIVPNHPVFLKRACGHVGVLNSLGLKLSGIDKNYVVPEGGNVFLDKNGEPTGIVAGKVQNDIPFPKATDQQLRVALEDTVQDEFLSKGVTTTSEMAAEPRFVRIHQQLRKEDKLRIRMRFYEMARSNINFQGQLHNAISMGIESGLGDDFLKFSGMKYLMDGSCGGKTAAISEPYVGDPENYGTLYNSLEDLKSDFIDGAKGGLQPCIHAIGDRAIEMALQALEAAAEAGADIPAMRVRFEHVELPSKDHIERFKKLGIVVGLSAGFIYSLGDSHNNVLGSERIKQAFPARSLLDAGLTVACNSDCPVCDINPLWGICAMVTRETMGGVSFGKEQSASVMEALKGYTTSAAYATFDEDKLGSIKAGKLADLVVLEEDIFSITPEKIKDVKVLTTMVDGKILYSRNS